jgi:hypothetical protein
MADDGKLLITLDLESGKFEGDIKVVKELLGGVGESGKTSAGEIAKGFALAEIAMEAAKEAFNIVKDTIVESIQEAMKYEESLNKVNLALANAGIYSDMSSKSMLEFASHMSESSIYSKEMVMDLEIMGINLSKSEDGAKKLTQAALELSSATGKDATTAMRILGQSMNGMTLGLDKLVPGLKNLSEEQLRAGAAADVIIARFGGSMLAATETFSGRLAMLKNSWNEMHTEMGKTITDSPIINRALEGITEVIKSVTKVIEDWVKGGGIESFLKAMISISDGIATYVVKPLEWMSNIGKVAFDVIVQGVDTFIFILAKAGQAINDYLMVPLYNGIEKAAKLIGTFNAELGNKIAAAAKQIADGATAGYKTLTDSTKAVLEEHGKQTGEDIKNMFETPMADSLQRSLVNVQNYMSKITKVKPDIKNKELTNDIIGVGEAFSRVHDGINAQAADLTKNAGKNFENLGKQMFTSIGTGAGNAFAAFGKALVTGKDGLAEFGKAMLSAMGQASIQMGTNFILQGAALTWADDPKGPPLMGAGAALAAFGGVLTGLGGGGSATASSSSGGSSSSPSAIGQPTQAVAQQPQKQAQIIINGDFLNSRETANHLADILRTNSDITDYSITAQGRSYI